MHVINIGCMFILRTNTTNSMRKRFISSSHLHKSTIILKRSCTIDNEVGLLIIPRTPENVRGCIIIHPVGISKEVGFWSGELLLFDVEEVDVSVNSHWFVVSSLLLLSTTDEPVEPNPPSPRSVGVR